MLSKSKRTSPNRSPPQTSPCSSSDQSFPFPPIQSGRNLIDWNVLMTKEKDPLSHHDQSFLSEAGDTRSKVQRIERFFAPKSLQSTPDVSPKSRALSLKPKRRRLKPSQAVTGKVKSDFKLKTSLHDILYVKATMTQPQTIDELIQFMDTINQRYIEVCGQRDNGVIMHQLWDLALATTKYVAKHEKAAKEELIISQTPEVKNHRSQYWQTRSALADVSAHELHAIDYEMEQMAYDIEEKYKYIKKKLEKDMKLKSSGAAKNLKDIADDQLKAVTNVDDLVEADNYELPIMDWQTEMYTQITRIHQVTKAKIRAEVNGKSFANQEAQTYEKICTATEFREIKELAKKREIEWRLLNKEHVKLKEEFEIASKKLHVLQESQVDAPGENIEYRENFMRAQTRALEMESNYHEILVKHNNLERDLKDALPKILKLETNVEKQSLLAGKHLLASQEHERRATVFEAKYNQIANVMLNTEKLRKKAEEANKPKRNGRRLFMEQAKALRAQKALDRVVRQANDAQSVVLGRQSSSDSNLSIPIHRSMSGMTLENAGSELNFGRNQLDTMELDFLKPESSLSIKNLKPRKQSTNSLHSQINDFELDMDALKAFLKSDSEVDQAAQECFDSMDTVRKGGIKARCISQAVHSVTDRLGVNRFDDLVIKAALKQKRLNHNLRLSYIEFRDQLADTLQVIQNQAVPTLVHPSAPRPKSRAMVLGPPSKKSKKSQKALRNFGTSPGLGKGDSVRSFSRSKKASPDSGKPFRQRSGSVLNVPSRDVMRKRNKSQLDLSKSAKVSNELLVKQKKTLKIKLGSQMQIPSENPLPEAPVLDNDNLADQTQSETESDTSDAPAIQILQPQKTGSLHSLNMSHDSEESDVPIDIAYEQINAYQFPHEKNPKERKRMFSEQEDVYQEPPSVQVRQRYERSPKSNDREDSFNRDSSNSPLSPESQKSPEVEIEKTPEEKEAAIANAVQSWIKSSPKVPIVPTPPPTEKINQTASSQKWRRNADRLCTIPEQLDGTIDNETPSPTKDTQVVSPRVSVQTTKKEVPLFYDKRLPVPEEVPEEAEFELLTNSNLVAMVKSSLIKSGMDSIQDDKRKAVSLQDSPDFMHPRYGELPEIRIGRREPKIMPSKAIGVDTEELRVLNALKNSVGVQIKFEPGLSPDQMLQVDRTMTHSEMRKYMFKVNPNSLLGLRGDVFSSAGSYTSTTPIMPVNHKESYNLQDPYVNSFYRDSHCERSSTHFKPETVRNSRSQNNSPSIEIEISKRKLR